MPASRGRACAGFAAPAELLEQRTLLSAQWPGAVVGVTPGSTGAGSSPAMQLVDNDGGATMIREFTAIYPIGPAMGPVAHASAAPRAAAAGFDIVLNKGPNLTANLAASAAFDQAANFFESIFHDPITVVIDAEIAPLGGSVLGQAQSVRLGDTFDKVRGLLIADANGADESIVSQLPAEADFLATLPDGSYSISGATANRANLLALGVDPSELSFPGSPESQYDPGVKIDASITFSSQFPFDYDRSDGIAFGKSDFVGVATHEIGHSLGFGSVVDQVDYTMTNGGTGEVSPSPLDMFRFEPGAGGSDFAGAYRALSPGEVIRDQVFYDGGLFDPSSLITSITGLTLGDVPFSTGVDHGDAWQASHWKDDRFLGGPTHTIGLMDPQAPQGLALWNAVDTRAMGLIGWDTTPAALPASISGTVYEDADGDGAHDAGEAGLSGWTVYQDQNNNGELDSGFASAGSNVRKAILDGRSTTSTLQVSGATGSISDLNLILDIQHTYIDDLTAVLVSPSGTEITLFRNLEPLFANENFEDTTFDDEAPWAIDDPQSNSPFTASYRPQQRLSLVDGEDPNGQWQLIVSDNSAGDEGSLNRWSLEFEVAEPSTETDGDGHYEFADVPAGTYTIRQVVQEGYNQTQPTGGAARVITVAEGQQATGQDFGDTQGAPTPSVVGRHVFYNHSSLDGNNAAAGPADDDAVAADKEALLAGTGPATISNYTSYSRGVNGIMVDVSALPAGGGLSASSFAFAVGNSNNPATWAAPARGPASVTVRRGAGDGGSDRVTIVWPDGVIRNQWLKVSVLATPATGLTGPDIFYFGNLGGETGNTTAAAVNGLDLLAVRRALVARPPAADGAYDFNRDGKTNALDLAVVKGSQGKSLTLFSAPPAELRFSEVPVAAAAALRTERVWDETPGDLLA